MELNRTTSIFNEIVDDTCTHSFNNNREYELLKDIYDEIKGKNRCRDCDYG